MKTLITLFFLFFSFSLFADGSMSQFELLSGRKKNQFAKKFWDKKYSKTGEYVFGKKPADFLAENYHYIPKGGKVLDVGMGEGRNAVYLARKGYKVTGVDISSVAIRKANTLANEYGVKIEAVTSSMQKFKADKESFDCIINFYYVDRKLNKKLVELLKPSGILIYESHTDNQRKVKGSEHYERRYLLRPGELLGLFPRLKILKYQEPLHEENFITSIILQKPE